MYPSDWAGDGLQNVDSVGVMMGFDRWVSLRSTYPTWTGLAWLMVRN